MPEVDVMRKEVRTLAAELSAYSDRFAALTNRPPCAQPLPARDAITRLANDLQAALFPGFFDGLDPAGAKLESIGAALEEQIRRGLCFVCTDPKAHAGCSRQASELTRHFLEGLPEIQRTLLEDVMAAYEGDPACKTPEEAILAYPGVYALTLHRIAHSLSEIEVPLLPRMIAEIAHGATGIDIHPGARIGKRFFMDHGTGVVIGETCIIGNHVRLYQGVTLGAKSFHLDEEGHPVKGVPRHPIIEDDVIIYAGATILGRVTIGRDSIIGGNVWLTRGVPPGSRVTQGSARYDAFHFGSGI